MSNISICPIDRNLSGATTPGQSEPWSDSNEGVLCFPQSSSIIWALPSDCFVSYFWTVVGVFYPSAEMQSVYSATPYLFSVYSLVPDILSRSTDIIQWIFHTNLFFFCFAHHISIGEFFRLSQLHVTSVNWFTWRSCKNSA